MFENCNEYWTQVVKDYADCGGNEITTKQAQEVAQEILDSDYIWDTIYSEIYNILRKKGVI